VIAGKRAIAQDFLLRHYSSKSFGEDISAKWRGCSGTALFSGVLPLTAI
jgi:hypothetical protein